jgi:DNA invertase Pin-like site-specific DNA recombinase
MITRAQAQTPMGVCALASSPKPDATSAQDSHISVMPALYIMMPARSCVISGSHAFETLRLGIDVLMVWSIDRLGRSVLHVANALAELDAAGVALYSDQQAIDSTTPMGRAVIQMASVFGEQGRSIIRSRVMAGLDRVRQQGKKLGRPKVSPKIEYAIRRSAGNGILKVAALVGCGSGTVQRVKREMAGVLAEAA